MAAGKPMIVKQRRDAGEVSHVIPRYTLCRCCWKVIPEGSAYCSPAHEAKHARLAS